MTALESSSGRAAVRSGSGAAASRSSGPSFLSQNHDEIANVFNEVKDVFSEMGESFKQVFQGKGSVNVGQLIKKLGQAIFNAILGALRSFAKKLIDSGFLGGIKDIINMPINIPIFSALYKTFISGGRELTLLSGFALVMAIPTTIIHKIVTKKAPPKITQEMANAFFAIEEGSLSPPKTLPPPTTLPIDLKPRLLGLERETVVTTQKAAARSEKGEGALTIALEVIICVAKFLEVVFVGIEYVEHLAEAIAEPFDGLNIPMAAMSRSSLKTVDPELRKFSVRSPVQARSSLARRGIFSGVNPWEVFKRLVGLTKCLASYPRGAEDSPAFEDRNLAWALAMNFEFLEMYIASRGDLSNLLPPEQVLIASTKGIFGLMQFGVHTAINIKELDPKFKDRDVALSVLRIFESIFNLASATMATGYGLMEAVGRKFPAILLLVIHALLNHATDHKKHPMKHPSCSA